MFLFVHTLSGIVTLRNHICFSTCLNIFLVIGRNFTYLHNLSRVHTLITRSHAFDFVVSSSRFHKIDKTVDIYPRVATLCHYPSCQFAVFYVYRVGTHSQALSRFVTQCHVWLRLDILWSYNVASHTLVMYFHPWSRL
jgi:hypothetical protein